MLPSPPEEMKKYIRDLFLRKFKSKNLELSQFLMLSNENNCSTQCLMEDIILTQH
jgi:hypothetical protein